MKKIAIVLITTMWFSASSADFNGDYQIFGIGAHKCSEISKKRQKKTYDLMYKSWMAGYLTSFNVHQDIGRNFTSLYPVAHIYKSIYKLCDENPSFELDEALFHATRVLKDKSYE